MTGIGASDPDRGADGGADNEVLELRRELDDSNQGLIALHAELSDRQEELERARATAEQATAAAEQASKDKADFLATMSHEIRSPMSAVIGFTGLLRGTELTGEQAEYTEAVEAAASHLLGVINGILDLSKIESGSLELEEIPFDLFACVEDAVDMMAVRAQEKNLALTALFAPWIPAAIVGDPLRLRQILVNLLANAVKFTTRGSVTIEVTQLVEAAAQAGAPAQAGVPPDLAGGGSPRQLVFRVRDTGSGIPADRLGLIFAPYAQADASTARMHGGTGLGLTISRQLTERMGGALTVDSTFGEGTTVTATIPARLTGLSPASGDGLFLSGAQVLLINDQALHADAISRLLTGWGAEVLTAASAAAALSRPGDWRRAALVIIDASRPATLAGDIARLTAASGNRALPIVCVAGMASRAAFASAGELRPSVRTPIRRDHLRQAVLAALGQTGKLVPAARSSTSMGRTDLAGPEVAGAGPAVAGPELAAGPELGAGPGAPGAGLETAGAGPEAAAPAMRVLHVDDDPLLTVLVQRIFAADPAVTVQTAPDGPTGLSLAVTQQPDILLLDLQLSGMSGEALLRQLRADARTRGIPAVILSGDASPAMIERLISLGAVAYLAKPFTSSQLREVVSAFSRQGLARVVTSGYDKLCYWSVEIRPAGAGGDDGALQEQPARHRV